MSPPWVGRHPKPSETAHDVTMVSSSVLHETLRAVITQETVFFSVRAKPVVNPYNAPSPQQCMRRQNSIQSDKPTAWESKLPLA